MIEDIIKVLFQIKEEELKIFVQHLVNSKLNRIFLIGNGGSSLTAQHFASDLANLGFDTHCLCENMARVTAITNDYGWTEVYQKQLRLILPYDLLIVISVHGGSDSWSNNLTKAAVYAQAKKAKVLSILGCDGGELAKISNFSIIVPSNKTYIIEGLHSVLTHIICEMIQERGNVF